MAKIISIWNNKGGVGKTTTVLTIGQILASYGKKILLIDLDPQGNLSRQLNNEENKYTSNDLLMNFDIDVKDIIKKYESKNIKIDFIPADLKLQYAPTQIIMESAIKNSNNRLENRLKPIVDTYDYIILDNAPTLDILVTNALVASDSVIVPIKSDKYSAEGITMIIKRIDEIKNEFNPKLKIEGIFLNEYSNTKINNQAIDFYSQIPEFLKTKINRATEIQENTVKDELLINSSLRNKNIISQYKKLITELNL
jgi:chromosome partitioning protein